MYFEKFLECIVSTAKRLTCLTVVYLLIPTSNHNYAASDIVHRWLFISWFLHQTTTKSVPPSPPASLFISWFLHQTTTQAVLTRLILVLFISWFLHQTTTAFNSVNAIDSCLSLDSYIKPQPAASTSSCAICCLSLDSYIKPQQSEGFQFDTEVVYLLIPTSNHNYCKDNDNLSFVVYLLIPTSNHNAQRLFL